MPRKRKNVVSADLFACTSESDSIPCGQSKFRCISSDSDSSDSDSLFSLNANLDVETVPERPQEPSTSSSSDCGPFGENFYSICQKLSSEEKAIKYCQSVGLLAKKSWCPNCKCVVSKLQQIKARTQSYTQYRFQCNKNKCKKSGRNTVPLRKGSWFSGTNLSVRKSILLLYCFSKKFPYNLAAEETRLSYDKGTSTETISDHYNYCRELCMNVVEKSGVNQIGGPGETVEIDEAKFGKRKYNRGRLVDGTWVFGGICRESRKFFLVPVEKRDAATLLPIIQAHIKEGSTIISDEWAAYRGISELGYAHQTVNHSKNFVDPESGACTNLIENRWWCVKRQLPSTHTTRGNFALHLSEYIWRSCIATEKPVFESLIDAISSEYSL